MVGSIQLSCLGALSTWIMGAQSLTLGAAYKSSFLEARDADFLPTIHGHELLFANDDAYDTANADAAAASVLLEPHLPTIVLEDHYSHFKTIACTEDEMIITFNNSEALNKATDAWTTYDEFTVITSHHECAPEAHHQAYIASHKSTEKEVLSLYLAIEARTLREVNADMHVDYGRHIVRSLKHRSAKRQDTAAISSTATPTETAPMSATMSFEFPSSTQSLVSSNMTDTFKWSKLDTILVPPDSNTPSTNGSTEYPDHFVLKCRECTAEASVSLVAGGFSTGDGPVDTLKSIHDGGFLQFAVNHMSAKVDLELDLLPGFQLAAHIAALPDISLGGITINGVINLGLYLSPTFPINVMLGSTVTLQAGFTLDVQDNSNLLLNLSHPDSSSHSGFNDTKISLLPFNMNAPNLAVNFTTGFQPVIKLGLQPGPRLDDLIPVKGGIGTVINLPQLSVEVKPLRNVNHRCQPSNSTLDKGDYISFVPSAEFSIAETYSLQLGSFINLDRTLPEVGKTTISLPTGCYMYQDTSSGLVDASTVPVTINEITGAASEVVVSLTAVTVCAFMGAFLIWL